MKQPSSFQRQVGMEVQRIGWGETRTYGEIAAVIGHPKSGPHVGAAITQLLECQEDMAAAIPWHRVTLAGEPDYLAPLDGPIDERTREQARRLVLEGHVLEHYRRGYRLKKPARGSDWLSTRT